LLFVDVNVAGRFPQTRIRITIIVELTENTVKITSVYGDGTDEK
jgi:hypothetical protein